MEAIRSSETSVQLTRSTWRHIPEDGIVHFFISLACYTFGRNVLDSTDVYKIIRSVFLSLVPMLRWYGVSVCKIRRSQLWRNILTRDTASSVLFARYTSRIVREVTEIEVRRSNMTWRGDLYMIKSRNLLCTFWRSNGSFLRTVSITRPLLAPSENVPLSVSGCIPFPTPIPQTYFLPLPSAYVQFNFLFILYYFIYSRQYSILFKCFLLILFPFYIFFPKFRFQILLLLLLFLLQFYMIFIFIWPFPYCLHFPKGFTS
jgi:hypothetical protein